MNYTMADLRIAAESAARSGLMPQDVKGVDAAFYIMASGIELGLQPMLSLRTLRLVKGRISIAAETMLALAIARGVSVDWKQADDTAAILTMTRSGHTPYTSTFTADDARKAGLGGDNWNKYRPAMLRARAISAGVRAYCPDVVSGLYTPEEVESFDDTPRTVQIEARPAAMQIEARPADAEPTPQQLKALEAVRAEGLTAIVDERHTLDPVVWTRADLLAISKLIADHRATKQIAAESATVAREDAASEARPATPAELFRRRVEKRIAECIAAGVMDATIEKHGDPDRWDHGTLTAIKAELAALAGSAA